ncbi:hypothetical protein V1512DRAFT_156880 [Lipomyces arxii]|uniref:uncharacterized protein n=1 Tax=Lipomyces arxii TaxID=56418 RepID=UPI0034CEA328
MGSTPNMTSVTAPSVSYFCIFNPTYCYSDETLGDQIFYFTSKADTVSDDEQLRKVGLIQGIISFASDFSSGKPVEIIDTRKTRTVILEIEPNWWIVFCVNFTRIQTTVKTTVPARNEDTDTTSRSRGGALASFRRRRQTEVKTDYSRKEVPGYTILHSQLLRGFNQWRMLYGVLPPSLVKPDHEKCKDDEEKDNSQKNEDNDDGDKCKSSTRQTRDDELAEFRLNLRKFWSWWLHKWELYMFSSATWGGTVNNSFLAHGLVLGSVPTLSFSFMDHANGIKMSSSRISDLTAETIKAIVKREARSGMVDLVITRVNTFSVVAPGGSLVRTLDSGHDGSSIKSGVDTDSIYSSVTTRDDGASVRSGKSRRSRFAPENEYGSDDESVEIDHGAAEDEVKNGCVFQGVGYISRTSIGEYSRWIMDNHIFPSPVAVEGVKWTRFSNKEEPTLPLEAIVFGYKFGYKRPMPPKRKSSKKSYPASVSGDSTNHARDNRNLANYITAKLSKLPSGDNAVSRVKTGSTNSTSTGRQRPDIKEDLSDAKFMVGLQSELELDGFESDEYEDDENEPEAQITFRDVYMHRKRRKSRTAPSTSSATPENTDRPDSINAEIVVDTLAAEANTPVTERLHLVIYKRAPFVFSAFFDPKASEQFLNDKNYYKSLHLRLGTLVEPIFDDLES